MYQFAFLATFQALEIMVSELSEEVPASRNRKELWVRDGRGVLMPARPVEWEDGIRFKCKDFGIYPLYRAPILNTGKGPVSMK